MDSESVSPGPNPGSPIAFELILLTLASSLFYVNRFFGDIPAEAFFFKPEVIL